MQIFRILIMAFSHIIVHQIYIYFQLKKPNFNKLFTLYMIEGPCQADCIITVNNIKEAIS